jgi:hypothetical protein
MVTKITLIHGIEYNKQMNLKREWLQTFGNKY